MVVKGKDDKTCHECHESRRRGGGDTSRSQHNNTITSASRDFESPRGIAVHQPSSQPISSTPRTTAHNYPAVSNASFSEMPVVMHRTTSLGQLRLNATNHAASTSATPRGYGAGVSHQNVDSPFDMSSHLANDKNQSGSTGEYHSLRMDIPDQSKQSTVDLYTLLQDSAGGTVKLQNTLRNQDPGLLRDALHLHLGKASHVQQCIWGRFAMTEPYKWIRYVVLLFDFNLSWCDTGVHLTSDSVL